VSIFWVDEDDPQFEFDRERIRARGIEVRAILDATTAYFELTKIDPSEITGIIIDVMLRPGKDLVRFSPEKCDGARRVGLVLIKELTEFFGDKIKGKSIIYTCATAEDIRGAIRIAQKTYFVPVLPKSPEIVGSRFSRLVTNYFKTGEMDDEFIRR
jgi:hypothetical protein